MYNRILKRPMFKRGGSSFKAQGTGITSPFDTPRKKYNIGAWGEWEEKVREQTGDPRGDWSYAAQGFSSLGNPYKESGEAKTIGEMLWEGAQNVRGSREKARELEQKGEMAILENQAAQMNAAQAHKYKLAEIAASEKGKTYPDIHPGKLYDSAVSAWKTWVKNNEGRAGHTTVSGNIGSFADADIVVRNQKIKSYNEGKTSLAEPVPPQAFDENNIIDPSVLSEGVVYYDPISKGWFTVHGAGETATIKEAESYIDGWHNIDKKNTTQDPDTPDDPDDPEESDTTEEKIKLSIKTNLKDVDINDKSVIYDEAAKVGIKIVENTGGSKTWLQNLAENEMSLPAFKKLLEEKKMKDTYANVSPKKRGDIFEEVQNIEVTEKMASGGRAGYAEGIGPLEDLQKWWKEQAWNNEG